MLSVQQPRLRANSRPPAAPCGDAAHAAFPADLCRSAACTSAHRRCPSARPLPRCAAVHAAQLPGHCVPRDQAVADRHGRHVCAATGAEPRGGRAGWVGAEAGERACRKATRRGVGAPGQRCGSTRPCARRAGGAGSMRKGQAPMASLAVPCGVQHAQRGPSHVAAWPVPASAALVVPARY